MKLKRQHNIFRERSVERLSSPERLDELMHVVSRRDWLPLSALGTLVTLGIFWSIFGKIPINIMSEGLLVRPGRVVDIQSPIQGQLKTLDVQVGDCVEKNDVLGTIDPSEIEQKLQLEKNKLARLQTQDREAAKLQLQRTNLETSAFQQQRTTKQQRLQDVSALNPIFKEQELAAIEQDRAILEQRLKNAQAMTPVLKDKELKAIDEQKISLQKELHDSEILAPSLKDRLNKRRLLVEQGAITADQLLQAEQEYRQTLHNIFKLKAQLKQLDVQKSEAEQKYLNNLNAIKAERAKLKELDIKETQIKQKFQENLSTISGLKAELRELETQEKRLEEQNQEASIQRKNQIQEVKYNIAQLSEQYQDNRQIKSPHAGCILELTTTNGSVLSQGIRLGSIGLNDSKPLQSITYFPVSEGKKVKPGMKIYITPDTVRREKFGGLVGTVTKVSAFPITKEGAANLVGNVQLVESLINKVGPVIEVQAQLQLDSSTPSGYKWSSSIGPENFKISSGTTTTARVTVEEQAAITLVLPILRQWSGIYSISLSEQSSFRSK